MNFLLDHDVPDRIAEVLKQAGHPVQLLRAVLPKEADDTAVLDCAFSAGAILITCNREDFLRLNRERQHRGLIILIRRKSRIAECAALLDLIDSAGASGLANNVNFA